MSGNQFSLKKANSSNCRLGGVYTISSDSQITDPCISNGHIKIPKYIAPEMAVCQNICLPQHGVDGWTQTFYMPMVQLMNSCYYSFQQLMRFHNGNLEVSAQRYLIPSGPWEPHFVTTVNSLQEATTL